MNTSPTISTEHVTRTPAICGGKPCVAGTRIRVQDVYVWHDLQGQSADEIVTRFPQLTHADVYAALAYFWDHRAELMAEITKADTVVEGLKRRFPSKLPKGGDGNAVSP